MMPIMAPAKLGVQGAKGEVGMKTIHAAGVQSLAAANRITMEKQQRIIDKLGVQGARIEAANAASKRAWSKVTSTDQSHWLGKRVKLTKRKNKGLIGTFTEVTLAGSLRIRLDGAKDDAYCPCLVPNSVEELCTDQPQIQYNTNARSQSGPLHPCTGSHQYENV